MSEVEKVSLFLFAFLETIFFDEINTPTLILVHSICFRPCYHYRFLRQTTDTNVYILKRRRAIRYYNNVRDRQNYFLHIFVILRPSLGFGILQCSGLILLHRMEFYADKTTLLGSEFLHPVTITFFLSQKVLLHCSVHQQYFILSASPIT